MTESQVAVPQAPATSGPTCVTLAPGDPAPWFQQRSTSNPRFVFDTVAGRYIVLCFFVSAAEPSGRGALDAALARRAQFDDERACFFGVSLDPADEREQRVARELARLPVLLGFRRRDQPALRGGAARCASRVRAAAMFRRLWAGARSDPARARRHPVRAGRQRPRRRASTCSTSLPPPARFAGFEFQAPVLFLPNVFEPELCRHLIALYETHGGEESGFMREIDGKTVAMQDHSHKRRSDYVDRGRRADPQTQARDPAPHRSRDPEGAPVQGDADGALHRRLLRRRGRRPFPRRTATTPPRARRTAASPSRSTSTPTSKAATSAFPNTAARFKPPPGGAVVFSCSLLHAVSPVTRGRRYAFLPFLYDEEAAKIREANNEFLGEGVGAYKAGTQAGQDLP